MRLRDSHISWRELDGEAVVLDLETSKYLSVNSAGTVLLRRLAEGDCSRAELADVLVSEFGIPQEQANADVERFVTNLTSRGLLDGE